MAHNGLWPRINSSIVIGLTLIYPSLIPVGLCSIFAHMLIQTFTHTCVCVCVYTYTFLCVPVFLRSVTAVHCEAGMWLPLC